MQFGIDSKHLDFFSDHNYIEFENLFSIEQIEEIKQTILQELQKSQKQLIENLSSKELFLKGRNLHFTKDCIAKIVRSKKLSKIAAELFREKILRIAYDQSFITTTIASPVFTENYALKDMSCFQPISGGVIIRLSEGINTTCDLLPKKLGSCLFFSPALPFPWSALTQEKEDAFLLIVYGPNRLMYILEKKDPHTHALKKRGLSFGDTVTNDTNPVVFIK